MILCEIVQLNLTRYLELVEEEGELRELDERRELDDEVLRVHAEALGLPARVYHSIAGVPVRPNAVVSVSVLQSQLDV